MLTAVVASGVPMPSRVSNLPVGWIVLACICAQSTSLIWQPIEVPMGPLGDEGWRTIVIVLAASAVLAGSACASGSWWGKWTFPTLVPS